MRFLIKSAFWLSLVLLLIPFDTGRSGDEPAVGPFEAFFAAREAVFDIGGICERKPDVCETGRAAMQTVMVRAREVSRMAFDMLEDENDRRPTGGDAIADAISASEEPVTTGSVPEARPSN